MVNVLAWSTTLNNRLSDGIISLLWIINQEEARLTNVAIGELLIRLILFKGPIRSIRVFFCLQLQAGRVFIFRAIYFQLLDCVIIAFFTFGLVEGFLQGIVVFGGLLRVLQVLYILIVLLILPFIFAQCLIILHILFFFLKIVKAAPKSDIIF